MSVNDKIRFDYRLVNPRWKYESMSNYYILRLFCVCVCVFISRREEKKEGTRNPFFSLSLFHTSDYSTRRRCYYTNIEYVSHSLSTK